jgi:hypothetical protein
MLRTLGVKKHSHRLLKAHAEDAKEKALAFLHKNDGETLKSQPPDT